ncbi:ABC transporter permease [Faecalicatena acetigenes]|uniref:ABC transporter permease n=1 Tax=Faecalicatena acetigenes TaxID=2981790 RepID=A0ABT2TCW1_9FIRM|nr:MULTISPECIES: ABC transporter permease [Lachnospiraceae]MCU6748120.1 ABC transporter permease [Faecalicatena acetigenes]SCI27049.1 ABC-2 family transporter protein [uncultured Clostridium sp.]
MKYFTLQIKRVCKAFPAIILTTIILAGALAALAYIQLSSASASEQRQKITLALVGDKEDPAIGLGVSLMQEMDSSRFTCALVDMEEAEAQKALERQEIQGYLLIPEDFIQSVMYGYNEKVTFVTDFSQPGISILLARELADAVSVLLTETQSGIYAFQRFAEQEDMTAGLDEAVYDMNIRYFNFVLPRQQLYHIDTPDSHTAISTQGYYFCSFLLLFFLFIGIAGCHLFVRSDLSLCRLLSVRGYGSFPQVLSEYAACCFLLLLHYLAALALLTGMVKITGITLPELIGESLQAYIKIFLAFGLLIPVTAGLLYLLSSLVRSLISAVILIFCCILSLGYISGCFYPLSFFPESLQKLAGFLPTGMSMEYMQRVLTGESPGWLPVFLCIWTILFLLSAWAVRRRRLA